MEKTFSVNNISDEELISICRAIETRYGIDFTNYEMTSFKRRVSRVIDKYQLENLVGLWRKVIYEKDFIHTFIDEITVGLTEMFRNTDLWQNLHKQIIPQLLNEHEKINIWHAGCSTGEEVYSMAILLDKLKALNKVNSFATDLNSQSVLAAKAGKYSDMYLTKYKQNYEAVFNDSNFSNYYSYQKDELHFNNDLVKTVRFTQHNLTKDPSPARFDIIFCRNVMIYFDDSLKMKVLKLFYESLNQEGLLIIGYYDALPSDKNLYFESFDSSLKIFKKI